MSRISYRKFVIVFLSLLFIGSHLYGGNTGKLTGIVLDDQTGLPVQFSNVMIKDTYWGAVTNTEGRYFILNIPPGTYTVIFSHIAYKTTIIEEVKIASDYTTEISIRMTPAAVEGEEVTVIAKRNLFQGDFTATRSILSDEEIENITSENLSDLLKLQPGMVQGSDGLFHLRGGRGNELRYFVDGIDVTDPYSSELSSVVVNNSAIQEMSVVSGTYNAEFGQALSGIVNLITKSGDMKRLSYGLSIYSGDYYSQNDMYMNLDRINATGIIHMEGFISGPVPFTKGNLTYFLSGKRSKSKGWLYGKRVFLPSDSSDFSPLDPEDWYVEATGDSSFVSLNPEETENLIARIDGNLGQRTQFHLTYLDNGKRFQSYSHLFKYNPDGNYHHFRKGHSYMVALNHTFSSQSFATLRLSIVENDYRYYVYKNPYDERYVDPRLFNFTAYNFYTGGTGMWNFHENSRSQIANIAYTSQMGDRHQIKVGFGAIFHQLRLHEFEIRLDESTSWQPTIPDISAPNHNRYKHDPVELSAFGQDKIEFEGLVLNIGVRWDYFSPDGVYPSDLRDPESSEKLFAPTFSQVSPRFGMAYPITNQGILHVSYGHFFQVPPFKYLYLNPEFEVEPGVLTSIIGNTTLKPKKSVIYEIGIQQQMGQNLSVDLTTFNKDIINMIGSDYHQLYDISRKYTRYANRDYGNVKGGSIVIKSSFGRGLRILVNSGYTYQIARGNASDPNALFYDLRATPPRETEKTLVYLDWDERHTFISSLTLLVPEKWNMGVTLSLGSGMPYTPEYQNQRTAFENSGRKPGYMNWDGQYSYQFNIGKYETIFFIKAYNIFDQKNEVMVYNDTGRAGYSLIPEYVPDNRYFPLADYLNRPDFFSEPRRILMGVKIQI